MNLLTKKEAIDYIGVTEKEFDNYTLYSGEISGKKINGRWHFDQIELDNWKNLKSKRTIILSKEDYEKCFEFAIRMVYGGMSLHGIRGQRSEVQASDDVILGILAEYALKKMFKEQFGTVIELDEDVHTAEITPQDICLVSDNNVMRQPKIGVGVKASKMKNAFLILGANEVESDQRRSDVYVFARVGLPSDHLFRILREHSFFKSAKDKIEYDPKSRKIEKLESVSVWICGYVDCENLEKVTEIPGQKFDKGHRYVKSVSKLLNSDDDWEKLTKRL